MTSGLSPDTLSQRCPLVVYGLSLQSRLPLGSIVIDTRCECRVKIV